MSPMNGAVLRRLGETRWHWQHGPIDLIIDLHGDPDLAGDAIALGFRQFEQLLPSLAACLPGLRRPATQIDRAELLDSLPPHPLARRVVELMLAAIDRYPDLFVTPMIAVAGSVAQAITEVLTRPELDRIIVNNGGDIALFLGAGQCWRGAIVDDPARPGQFLPRIVVPGDSPVRGIATSGWRGRSFSLGIADAVTVLADHAADADAAATLIANAVDTDSPAVERAPASTLDPQTDLGQRFVTTNVKRLSAAEICAALRAGQAFADQLLQTHQIRAYRIALAGQYVQSGSNPQDPKRHRSDLLMSEGMSECGA